MNRPDPLQNPRSYLVDLRGKAFRRTREHIRPRSIKNKTDSDGIDPKIFVTPPKLDFPPELGTDDQASNMVPDKVIPTSGPQPVNITPASIEPSIKDKQSYQPRAQSTRCGRITVVPAKYSQ